MQVNIKQGYLFTVKEYGRGQNNLATLQDALTAQADCGPCGCNDCFGYSTHVNAETGDIMMTWITGTGGEEDPYVVNIDTFAAGLVIVKALKAARTE